VLLDSPLGASLESEEAASVDRESVTGEGGEVSPLDDRRLREERMKAEIFAKGDWVVRRISCTNVCSISEGPCSWLDRETDTKADEEDGAVDIPAPEPMAHSSRASLSSTSVFSLALEAGMASSSNIAGGRVLDRGLKNRPYPPLKLLTQPRIRWTRPIAFFINGERQRLLVNAGEDHAN
jgi:hypothetical protein